MKIIRTIRAMQRASRAAVTGGRTVAVVPTMGFLHEGHLSLMRRAKKEADVVIVTIFVNPTQFAPNEDLDRYPRDERGDIKKIASAGGDIVFIPDMNDIYPGDFETWVTVEKLTSILEGASRPTHFRGVTTIVSKLFNITRPDVAVFGMKDYQQAMVLKRMTVDLNFPIKFIIAPTVRESDGLAMSSRNKYFSEAQRTEAVCLYRALQQAKAMVKSGEMNCATIRRKIKATILNICPTAKIEYIAFTDFETIKETKTVVKGTICSLAVRVHSVRLIDNRKLI
jgi:pantoate--beta-alanine ligase